MADLPRTDLPAPPHATFDIIEISFAGRQIQHVIALVSYPYISITHEMQISRVDLINLLQADDQFNYQGATLKIDPSGSILPVEKP